MIRIGVVGGGTYGESHLTVFKGMEEGGKVKLVGLAEQNEERRNQRAEQFGIPVYANHVEMMEKEELDGVTIATPDHLHLDIAMDVLERGIHCFVEKPLDVTVDGCKKMIARAKEKSVLLQVDFHKRYDPYHIEMREAYLDSGESITTPASSNLPSTISNSYEYSLTSGINPTKSCRASSEFLRSFIDVS